MSRDGAAVDVAALAERVAALEAQLANGTSNHTVLQGCHNRLVGRVEQVEALAAEYGVSRRCANGAITGTRWAHVEEPPFRAGRDQKGWRGYYGRD